MTDLHVKLGSKTWSKASLAKSCRLVIKNLEEKRRGASKLSRTVKGLFFQGLFVSKYLPPSI